MLINVLCLIVSFKFLSFKLEMKYLGESNVILGIKIERIENGFSLSQAHYVEKLLRKFNCFDVVPTRTPSDPSNCLKKNDGNSVSTSEFVKIIGSIIYFMNCTRPDIAYVVSR